MELSIISYNKDSRKNNYKNHSHTHKNNDTIKTFNKGNSTEELFHKMFQVLPILFKVIKLVHYCRKSCHWNTLKSIEEKGKHHFISRFFLKLLSAQSFHSFQCFLVFFEYSCNASKRMQTSIIILKTLIYITPGCNIIGS